MNILIICNSTTGLETFRGMLIGQLVKQGNIVKIIVPQSDEKKEIDAENRIKKWHCNLVRIAMDRRGMNPLKDSKLFWKLFTTIKKIRPDLVITYTIKPNIYGGFVSRLLKIPYVVNITGLGTAFQKDGMLRNVVILMYKIALKNANVVFFENTENRDEIINAGIIPEQKSHVLAGAGVDLEHFQYMEYPPDAGTIRFLFIGRVMKEKGIEELFDAMRRLQKSEYKCELDVLGGFEEDYKDIIERYEKEGWLHYRGYQSDVRPFIESAHCFVLPSWHEGMANTNLECAASGRPIITSDIHGCKEAVIDGVSGYLVKKQSKDDLYYTMLIFLKKSFEEKKEMGIYGRKLMYKSFDKKKVVQETLEFIDKMVIEEGRI